MALNLYCCLRHSHTNFLVFSHSFLGLWFRINPDVMSPSRRKANGSRCSCIGGEIDGISGGESFDLTCTHCNSSDSIKSDPASSWFLSSLSETKLDDSEKLRRIIVASLKGFSIGTGIKGGLALFSIIVRFARRRSSSKSR